MAAAQLAQEAEEEEEEEQALEEEAAEVEAPQDAEGDAARRRAASEVILLFYPACAHSRVLLPRVLMCSPYDGGRAPDDCEQYRWKCCACICCCGREGGRGGVESIWACGILA